MLVTCTLAAPQEVAQVAADVARGCRDKVSTKAPIWIVQLHECCTVIYILYLHVRWQIGLGVGDSLRSGAYGTFCYWHIMKCNMHSCMCVGK